MAVRTRLTGTVSSFDEHGGYGLVVGADGQELFFHCTAIADGSRTIEVGVVVAYEVRPGHLGRWEASGLRPAWPIEADVR